jgi:hypothetical protein
VTYSNNLEKIETIRDDGLIEGADPTIAALTGRIDVRFADTTLIDLAAGGTPVDLEFAYTLSAQAKLVLTAHEVYLPKPKLAVEGPGGVQASFDFRVRRTMSPAACSLSRSPTTSMGPNTHDRSAPTRGVLRAGSPLRPEGHCPAADHRRDARSAGSGAAGGGSD